MPEPCADLVADPSVKLCEGSLCRALARHRRRLEMAELALARARSDESRATLGGIVAFHRLRIAVLSRRLRRDAADSGL